MVSREREKEGRRRKTYFWSRFWVVSLFFVGALSINDESNKRAPPCLTSRRSPRLCPRIDRWLRRSGAACENLHLQGPLCCDASEKHRRRRLQLSAHRRRRRRRRPRPRGAPPPRRYHLHFLLRLRIHRRLHRSSFPLSCSPQNHGRRRNKSSSRGRAGSGAAGGSTGCPLPGRSTACCSGGTPCSCSAAAARASASPWAAR